MGALKGLACIVAAIVLNFPLLFAQEVRHRTLKTEGIKLPRTGRKVQRDAVRANSQASKKMGDIKPLYISPEKNAAFKAFEGPKLPISHQMPPVANAEAVAKHNEEVIARRGLDKDQPSKRNLNTPVKAESEDAALFIDTHSEYTLGLKSLVLVIMCPGGHDCENDVPPYGYNTGIIDSTHFKDVDDYMDFLVRYNHNFYVKQSFGAMGFNHTIVKVTLDSYDADNCGGYNALGVWSYDDTALDVLLNEKVKEAYGMDPLNDFDFQVYTLPYCSSLSWAGVGWVGVPGSFLSVTGSNYDQAFAHEVGHNIAAWHAAIITTGSRGAKAWNDGNSAAYPDWIEYGNPHSTMGSGEIVEFDADFLVAGKIMADWIDDDHIAYVDYDEISAGTITLTMQSTDSGTLKNDGSFVGVVIDVAGNSDYSGDEDRYFFLEYRTSSPMYLAGQSQALLINWMDVAPNNGITGTYGTGDEMMVLTDCSDWTTADSHNGFDDAGCIVGQVKTIDIGTESNSREIDIKVDSIDTDGNMVIEIGLDLGDGIPQPTTAPTGPCGDYEVCCPEIVVDGWAANTPLTRDGCCHDRCIYKSDYYSNGPFYFSWNIYYNEYYMTAIEDACSDSDSISHYGIVQTDVGCPEPPTPEPSLSPFPIPSPTSVTAFPIPSPTSVAASPIPAPTSVAVSPIPAPTSVAASPIPAPTSEAASPIPAPTSVAASPIPAPTSAPVPTSHIDSTEDGNDDGPDDGALEVIGDAVSDYWFITKELFKDLWSHIAG